MGKLAVLALLLACFLLPAVITVVHAQAITVTVNQTVYDPGGTVIITVNCAAYPSNTCCEYYLAIGPVGSQYFISTEFVRSYCPAASQGTTRPPPPWTVTWQIPTWMPPGHYDVYLASGWMPKWEPCAAFAIA